MAFDAELADRIRKIFEAKKMAVTERKMFGGLSFLLRDKMCCGVLGSKLAARIGPDQYEKALRTPGVKPMDFTGRSLKGFVYVEAKAIKNDKNLNHWVEVSADYVSKLRKTKKRS
ncbi:MAG: TfoX/Sxy family protein [Parachlamydiales bacterium]